MLGDEGADRRVGTDGVGEGWRGGKANLMGLKKLEERGFRREWGGEGGD